MLLISLQYNCSIWLNELTVVNQLSEKGSIIDLIRGRPIIESFPDQKLVSGHHGDSWKNKLAKHDDRVSPLSQH